MKMKNDSIQLLTDLQKELGYKNGEISTIAMLGLIGEAGEVLAETDWYIDYRNTGDPLEEMVHEAVTIAEEIDELKKDFRNMPKEFGIPTVPIDEDNLPLFDAELADCFYYLNIIALNRGLTVFDLAQKAFDKIKEKQASGGSSEDKKS